MNTLVFLNKLRLMEILKRKEKFECVVVVVVEKSIFFKVKVN